MHAFRVQPGATECMELQPGRMYVIRFWLGSADLWESMASLIPAVCTAMPAAEAPYYVTNSLVPIIGLESGLTENCEVVFYASAPVLVISHAAEGDTDLLVAITPITVHD